jgi:hypothetical protein
LRRVSDYPIASLVLQSRWLGLLFHPLSRYLSGAGAASILPIRTSSHPRFGSRRRCSVLGGAPRQLCRSTRRASSPAGSHDELPIRGVTDVRNRPVLSYPSPVQLMRTMRERSSAMKLAPEGARARRTPAGPGTGPVLGSGTRATSHRRRAMYYRPR